MNTIIAATDYSVLAENAVEYAAGIAKRKKEQVVLLNDIAPAVHAENAHLAAARFDALLEENRYRLQKRASLLSDKFEITVIPRAMNSYVENELNDLIAEYNAYMVVMGMSSKSAYHEIWGHDANSVIKKVPVNVLAVPANASFEGLKKVLFACDAIHGVTEALLERVKGIAHLVAAEIEVLMVSKNSGKAKEADGQGEHLYSLEKIGEGLKGVPFHYENVDAESIVEGIRKEIVRSHAGLLVMAPQKHGFWDSLVHRSKTRMMASGLDIPLLSVPI